MFLLEQAEVYAHFLISKEDAKKEDSSKRHLSKTAEEIDKVVATRLLVQPSLL
jgi:hypothetical protein